MACGQGSKPVADSDVAIELSRVAVVEETVNVEESSEVEETAQLDSVEPLETEAVSLDSEPMELLSPVVLSSFTLKHGETLAHFARWSEMTVEEIAEYSDLDLSGNYAVGTEIFLPVTGEDLAQVTERRDQHRERKIEGYLNARGGALGSDFYTVATGDTAWSIAHSGQGIPIWVLDAYNPGVQLDRLVPGQQLMVPILSDTVVDATE